MAEPQNKPFYKRWSFIAIIAILVISFLANLGDDDNGANKDLDADENNSNIVDDTNENITNENEQEEPIIDENNNSNTVENEEQEEVIEEDDKISFGSGMFLVNDEIEPGLYRNDGGITYWGTTIWF